ncbi:MAG: ABC-2 family transporter protein [Clostridia bacterium]|nr:ABC-2 family transporter protein [Clostridia bacterium]
MRYVVQAVRMNLRRAAQYRSSFLLQTIAQLIMTGGDLWAVLMLLERFGGMGHWGRYEILFFFGAMHLVFSFTEIADRGLGRFSSMIRTGSFDTVLVRPRGALLQVMLAEMDPRRIGSILVALTSLIVASRGLALRWTAAKILLLLWSAMGTGCLMMGLFLLEAVVCFFSVQSIEIVNVLTYGGRQVCQYPMDLYTGWIRTLFTAVVPIALCLQMPVSVILERQEMLAGMQPGWVWAFPLLGPCVFGLIALIWMAGVRHYRSTGT